MYLFLFFFFFVNVSENCKLGHVCEQVTNSTVEIESKAKKKKDPKQKKKTLLKSKGMRALYSSFSFFFFS